MVNSKTVRTICGNCIGCCGALIQVEDGRIVKAEGDPQHPFSRGYFDLKGEALPQIIYHPERLKHPLKRVGGKGEGKWKQISWDEALGEIADKLRQVKREYGAEAFVLAMGYNAVHDGFYGNMLLHLFGSPNRLATYYACGIASNFAALYTFGFVWDNGPDLEKGRCIIVWGANPDANRVTYCPEGISSALARGAKLIVVDPRRTDMVTKANVWLQVRPGTDGALALGMLNVIINEGLYDNGIVENWVVGFDKLSQHVQQYPPQKVEGTTWVPSGLIREAAHMYAENRPSSIIVGTGLSQSANAFQASRAIAILAAICGNVDVPGGNVDYRSPLRRRSSATTQADLPFGKLSPEQIKKRLGADEFRLVGERGFMLAHPRAVWRAIVKGDPYPVKAMLAMATNPLLVIENALEVREALMKLDFFAVSELFMTPTAELADIVLPAAHWSEREGVVDEVAKNYVFPQPKVVEPSGECWEDGRILVELARRLGLEGYWNSVEEALNWRLESLGITFEQLKEKGMYEGPVEYRKYEKFGRFLTDSGKIDLYSESLEKLGYEPLPTYVEPPESPVSTPGLAEAYPLILITGIKIQSYQHSAYRNIPSLRETCPDPLLDIHPETAEKLGIKDGDWIRIETLRGSVKHKAKLFDGIHPQVVSAPIGWWYGYKDGWREVNINTLTDNKHCDPQVGCPPMRGLLCRVTKEPHQ
jgi:thiosulfate reductase/polysulfide reductase chain A